MKPKLDLFGAWWAPVLALALWPPSPAMAEYPLPGFTYYGEVRNPYGGPYTRADQAQLVVRVNGRECGRTAVDERLGPGINFRVEVPLDDGMGALYASFAARINDRPTFVIQVGTQEFVVMDPTNSPPINSPGGIQRVNFFADTDADSDGMPDTWEEMIILASNGRFTNINQVLPGDDFDGDGVSNQDEFLAGTDPTWAVDRLVVDSIVSLPEINSFGVGFYSVRAKSYQLQGTPSFLGWQDVDFSVNQTNKVYQKFWRGDGYYSWFFVDTLTNSQWMFRLKVQ